MVLMRRRSLTGLAALGEADRDLVAAVDLLDVDVHALVGGGRQVLADVVGPDRQLAVAAVDQHRQLHPRRAAVVEEHVDRRADGAAGVEHVVDDHDRAVVDREVELGECTTGARPARIAEVVAVEA